MAVKLVKALALLVWIGSMGWLVRYEAFPDWFVHSIHGYKSLIRSKPAMVDSWMKVEMDGTHIGYSHTVVGLEDEDGQDQYNIHNVTMLKLLLLGEKQQVKMTSDATLDGTYAMQEFLFGMSSRNYVLRIEGKKVGKNDFDVTIKTSGSQIRKRVKIPPDAVIYSPYLEMVLKELEPGESTRLKIFDPMSMETSMVLIQAEEDETIQISGKDMLTTRLAIDFNGMSIGAWMDEDGQIVRQKTPFGWTMEACTPDEALSYDERTYGSVDMVSASGVQIEGEIGERESKATRYLRLKGVSIEPGMLATRRQTVLESGDNWVDLRIDSPAWPSDADARNAAEEDMTPYLTATDYIQSDHPDIVNRAKSITRDTGSDREKVQAIYDWVHRTVQKIPTVSLPSALDVLRNMQGDCNEHTYLFVALARAADLPAKVRVGIVYVDGIFGYHAWPSVYFNGAWVDIDPTLGQTVVDSTHISLLEGELKNQMMLVQYLGQLKVEVLREGIEP